ncbi:cation diffusion facilitator family transporter [Porticoccaceae bacterium LTM1]|nr:cation diffusion facilitator family transporter [Porticoccaceae bacterium LTM1]
MAGADSVKSIFYALFANSAIAVAKGVGAWFTGSGAMLAEAVHSLADCTNQALLLLGIKRAKRPPSPDYPLGTGKEIYFWSFIVALLLFSVGGLFSIYEGVHKLHEPEPLSYPWVAIGILSFAVVAEGLSLLGCMREVDKVRGKRSYWGWFRATRQSDLMVIFGEDLAALVGLVLALIAVVASMITGNPMYDACGSIAIGVLLVLIAILIGREVKALLVGEGVDPAVKAEMRQWLSDRSEVDEVYNLLTLQMGNDVMVAVKARMASAGTAQGLVADINRCEVAFRQAFPQIQWLFFEPDCKD